ncbi:DUF5723 family protein [Orenia marismortui]|uniref:DUF5723 family protein n=1 Tax=Orenia marismortui TaxID=46469 RepID=UPI00037C7895|nr:DUF5723 family protein [Orenia marismortui]
MIKKSFLVLLLSFIVVCTFNTAIFAVSSAKMIGLGDNFVTVTGADALYANPAAVNANNKSFTLEMGLSLDVWNNMLINDYIDESEKDELLDKTKDGFLVGGDGQAGLKLIIGPMAMISEARADALIRSSSDLAELILKGNEIGRDYNFDNTVGSGGVYGDLGLNFSVESIEDLKESLNLKDLYFGFTYHRLEGMIFDLEGKGKVNVDYDSEDTEPALTSDGDFLLKYSDEDELASGSALDFGAYAELNDKYSIGFSVMNLGSLTSEKIHKVEYKYNEVTEEFEEIGDSDTIIDEDLEWTLPSIIRLGAKMNYSEDITFFSDYSYTKYHDGDKDHKFSAATELTWLKSVPLRTGINYSTLREDFNWSAGLGLYLWGWKTDVGVSDLMGLFNKSQGVEFALTTKLEF